MLTELLRFFFCNIMEHWNNITLSAPVKNSLIKPYNCEISFKCSSSHFCHSKSRQIVQSASLTSDNRIDHRLGLFSSECCVGHQTLSCSVSCLSHSSWKPLWTLPSWTDESNRHVIRISNEPFSTAQSEWGVSVFTVSHETDYACALNVMIDGMIAVQYA